MWDRFKKWKKDSTEKNICPLCQHINSASAETCSSCSYQLNKPNYKQTSNIEESETNNLFDELMNEFEEEKETEVIDWSKATFKMDDVTVDVNQYSEED
jgi:ribosomal protein L40E